MDTSIFLAGTGGLLAGATAAAVPAKAALHRAAVRARELSELLCAVRYEATHDSLTGLANRAAFYACAAPLLANQRHGPLVVALVDLDNFKQVNDAYGHGTGDLVLHAVARRLHEWVGEAGLVARLGGDEFAVLAELGEQETPRGLGGWLRQASAAPLDIDDTAVNLTLSVGLVLVEGPADLTVLLGRADAAMYRAKHNHLGVAVFDPVLDDHPVPIPGVRPDVRIRDLALTAAVAPSMAGGEGRG